MISRILAMKVGLPSMMIFIWIYILDITIDFRHALMNGLIHQVLDRIRTGVYNPTQLTQIQTYFPTLTSYIGHPDPKPSLPSNHQGVLINLAHLREYFCDLFAAQYIGEAS